MVKLFEFEEKEGNLFEMLYYLEERREFSGDWERPIDFGLEVSATF